LKKINGKPYVLSIKKDMLQALALLVEIKYIYLGEGYYILNLILK